MAIPKNLTVERLLRVSMTAIRNNPKLLDCSQQSLLACIMGCATLGLEPEPFLGQAYMVPYFNKKKNCLEAQLIPGYRGYITLARRSGEVQSVQAQVVYENDFFNLQYGLRETLDHTPAEGDRGEVKGAYVIFRYKDGSYSFDYMPKSDIDKIKGRSKSANSGPWVTDYPEMAKKTVIRRHVKLAPLSVELAKATEMETLALAGESQEDLFIPPDEVVVSESSPKTEPEENDIDMVFAQNFGGYADEPLMDKFIQASAAHFKISEAEVKTSACDDPADFAKKFEGWAEKYRKAHPEQNNGIAGAAISDTDRDMGKAQDEPAPDPEQAFIDEWWNKRTAGYSTYFFKNKQRFVDASPVIKEKARDKWFKIYGDKAIFPLDKEPILEQEKSQDDFFKSETIQAGPENLGEIAPPQHNTVIPADQSEAFLEDERQPKTETAYHSMDEMVAMPTSLQRVYNGISEKAGLADSIYVSPKAVNTYLKRECPDQWESVRNNRGFGFIPASDEAADVWNNDIALLVDEGMKV